MNKSGSSRHELRRRQGAHGWREVRLQAVASAWPSSVDKHNVEGEIPVRLCNYTDVYNNDAITGDLQFMRATATAEEIARFKVVRGDTVITKDSETAEDIGVPAFVDYEAPDLVCGYHLAIVRPRPSVVDPRFLYWVLESNPVRGQWSGLARGVTRVGLRSSDLTKVRFLLPGIPEQRQISDFLDVETAQIDRLIAEQDRLANLLHERRKSATYEAVTRGLRSTTRSEARGKSGIERSPVDSWDTVRLRYLCTITTGSGDTQDAVPDAPYPFIVRSPRVLSSPVYTFDTEAILTAGDGAVGEVFHHVTGRFHAHQRVYVLKDFHERVYPRFLYHAFASQFGKMASDGSARTTVDSVRRWMLTDMPIPLPPLAEQVRIAAALDAELAQIDVLLAEQRRFTALARERRAALITAAVTGQLDITRKVA